MAERQVNGVLLPDAESRANGVNGRIPEMPFFKFGRYFRLTVAIWRAARRPLRTAPSSVAG